MSRARSNPTQVRLYDCLNAVSDVWLSHDMHDQALAGLSAEKGDLQLPRCLRGRHWQAHPPRLVPNLFDVLATSPRKVPNEITPLPKYCQ